MANSDLLRLSERKKIIDEIKGPENQARKELSFKQTEVQRGRLRQYVIEQLEENFEPDTVKEMPIISTLNIQKRILAESSTVYSKSPDRRFTGLTDEQEGSVRDIYKAARANAKLKKSNENFKLQQQNALMLVPKKGDLIFRTLKGHHYDVIPEAEDPETAFAYIISTYDRSLVKDANKKAAPTGRIGISETHLKRSDQVNQGIADPEDYQSSLERYVFWTNDYNFKCDGKGRIILEDGSKVGDVNESDRQTMEAIESPLKEYEIMPFIDISEEKDFEFFVRQEDELTDYTIQFNASATDVNQTVRMQTWSQSVLKGPKDMVAEEIRVGVNRILKLVEDPENGITSSFEYVNTNANIEGAIRWLEVQLSTFLSTKGIDPKVISTTGEGTTFNSGIERLVALFEKFSANAEDYEIYARTEDHIFAVIRAWVNASKDNLNLLDKKWLPSTKLPMDSTVSVIFHKPEAVQSEQERIDNHTMKNEQGLTSRIEYFEKEGALNRAEATARVVKVDLDKQLIEAATDPNRHRHEGLSAAINVGNGKHTHIDLKTGERVKPAAEGENHKHTKEDGSRSSAPIEGGF